MEALFLSGIFTSSYARPTETHTRYHDIAEDQLIEVSLEISGNC